MPLPTLNCRLLKPTNVHGLKHTLMVPMLTLSLPGSLDGESHLNSGCSLVPQEKPSAPLGSFVPLLCWTLILSVLPDGWKLGWTSGANEHINNVAEAAIQVVFDLKVLVESVA